MKSCSAGSSAPPQSLLPDASAAYPSSEVNIE
jgi:hypothetical protein